MSVKNYNSPLLVDELGRVARYLRLSVTDRCNLRCVYCQSDVAHKFIPHENILRYEEMLCAVGAAVGMGIKKIRLTGGEPFARKGFISLVEMLHNSFPDVDLRITSNATLLKPYINELRTLGVRGLNISLDSFDRATFERITRKDALYEVLSNIDQLLSAGINIKINAVAMRGVSDKELKNFVEFATQYPVDVRFIEFMPMGSDTAWSDLNFISSEELISLSAEYAGLSLDNLDPPAALKNDEYLVYNGPARMYKIEGGRGRLGFISAMSNHFCNTCNRLRLTSDGFVRTCLFADKENAVRGILRSKNISKERKEELVQEVINKVMKKKPLGEALLKARQATAVASKNMVSIGG